ncbi:MAG: hypothetical protein ACR2Q4_10880 [Geminicoccaceae bacterium]
MWAFVGMASGLFRTEQPLEIPEEGNLGRINTTASSMAAQQADPLCLSGKIDMDFNVSHRDVP